jgi:hypothetical protein
MADMAIFLNDRIGARKAVHDAGILQVGSGFQNQAAKIAAQAGTGANIAVRADYHIADQYGTGVNIGAGINDWNDAVYGVNT